MREESKKGKPLTVDDAHDIEKHLLNIHTDILSDVATSDLLMACLDEKEKKYVTEQLSLAHEADHLIVEPKQREYAKRRLLLKGMAVVWLKRNDKVNPFAELLLRKKEEMLLNENEELDQRVVENVDKLTKKK